MNLKNTYMSECKRLAFNIFSLFNLRKDKDAKKKDILCAMSYDYPSTYLKRGLAFAFFFFSFSSSVLLAQDEDGLSVRHRKVTESSLSALAQNAPDAYIKITSSENFTRNDSLVLKFSVAVKGNVIGKRESLSLVPEYIRGTDAFEFPAILINGKRRASYYRRERALANHEEYWQNKPYVALTADKKLDQEVSYEYALPLPEGESLGGLHLKHIKQDCCDVILEKTDTLSLVHKIGNQKNTEVKLLVVGYPEYQENVTYLTPEPEREKIRRDTIVIRIDYPLNQSKVLPNFSGNHLELARINRLFQNLVKDSETYQIQKGTIIGYASPEATYGHNLKLSERRAQAFYEYFLEHYGSFQLPSFHVEGKGEDWLGLEKAVEKTSMQHRNKVLHIIRTYGIFEGREKQLMNLAGGDPYRYMLRVLFPPLRRMEMTLEYKVRSFSAKEATEVWQERPQDLSQQELYKVAEVTKDQGPLEVAAEYFPKDATANINASSVALIKGNLEKAYEHLQKVWDNPKAYNNIGVYYMLKEDYEQARLFFEKAMKVDSEKAQANLQLLDSLKK